MDAVPTHFFFHANCVNLRTESSLPGEHVPPQPIGSFVGCTSLDTEMPPGCVQLRLVLPFPDSRRQKAEVAAVCVKAGQRPPRNGRRALTRTAPRLHSRCPGNGCDWFCPCASSGCGPCCFTLPVGARLRGDGPPIR